MKWCDMESDNVYWAERDEELSLRAEYGPKHPAPRDPWLPPEFYEDDNVKECEDVEDLEKDEEFETEGLYY